MDEYDYQQLFIKAEIELEEWSLVPDSRNIQSTYEEFARDFPVLNQLANEAMEFRDLQDRKVRDSYDRAFLLSIGGVILSLCTMNVPGIILTSGSLYVSFLTSISVKD